MVNVLYRTRATASGGGRAGRTALDDSSLGFNLVVPRELGGAGGAGANPEQLFALGYAACYLGALRNVARRKSMTLPEETSVVADVGIGPREDGGGYGLDIVLNVSLPGLDRATVAELTSAAHGVCPYSHALKHGVDIRTLIV